jgi:thymidylate kinase
MTATLIQDAIRTKAAAPSDVARPSGAGALLSDIFDALEAAGVPYVVLHGYGKYFAAVPSDVDLLVPKNAMGKFAAALKNVRAAANAPACIVQWVADRAHFIVLVRQDGGGEGAGSPSVVQLHVSPDYEMAGRVFFRADEILSTRRQNKSFWIPAANIEFGCILANRIAKGVIRDDHAEQLTKLMAESPQACTDMIGRWFTGAEAELILKAAKLGEWEPVRGALPRLKEVLLRHGKGLGVGGAIGKLARRVRRWIKPPNGLHVVFLGPDGVGKSTIIEGVEKDLEPAFLGTLYQTFAPSLLPQRMQAKPSPHAYPPRSFAASLLKAGWWFCCYTGGYMVVTHPARARAQLVLNHRYLPDAIADPKRYRYGGPMFLLRLTWLIAPKPDLIILLDAPSDVIWARKKEVAREETARQRAAYKAVVGDLPYTTVVDTAQSQPEAIAATEKAILDVMEKRAARIVRRFA